MSPGLSSPDAIWSRIRAAICWYRNLGLPAPFVSPWLDLDLDFMTGIEMEKLSVIDAPRAERLVRLHLNPLPQQAQGGAEGGTETDEPSQPPETPEASETPGESDAAKQGDAAEGDAADKDDAADQADKAAEQEEPANQQEPANQPDVADQDEAAQQEPAGDTKGQDEGNTDAQADAPSPSDAQPAVGDQAASAAQPPSVMDTTPWLKENPLELTREVLQQGQQVFGIYCSVCHGLNGSGNGLVNQRARKILSPTWIPPSSLHQESLYADQYPDGKLFNTISNGIRKMPGYASQIKVRDRWAIVAYVRALQESQNASIDLVPEELREEILQRKSEVDQKLEEQAEAERQAEEERAKQAEGQAS